MQGVQVKTEDGRFMPLYVVAYDRKRRKIVIAPSDIGKFITADLEAAGLIGSDLKD